MPPSPALHVAAAVIEQGERVLIARRPQHLHQGGKWEFPGGKVEAGETVAEALIRELREEVDITPSRYHPLIRIHHDYGDRRVLLDVWRVSAFRGEARGSEGQEVRWVARDALPDFRFPQANGPIVSAARLPDRYLITPEPVNRDGFLEQLEHALSRGIQLVQLRAKTLTSAEYLSLAHEVLARCRHAGARLLLNGDPELLSELDADGIHLDGTRLMALRDRPLAANKWLAASCHDSAQLQQAASLGTDFVVLSPVAATRSHPGAKPLGWEGLRALSEQAAMPVYALGGMGPDDLPRAWEHGAQGIAAIRRLWEME